MSSLVRAAGLQPEVIHPHDRRTAVQVRALERQTLGRLAGVQADSMVAAAKLQELERLGAKAMLNQSMLTRYRETLAAGDPLLQDELRVFADVAKLGQLDVLADFIEAVRRR